MKAEYVQNQRKIAGFTKSRKFGYNGKIIQTAWLQRKCIQKPKHRSKKAAVKRLYLQRLIKNTVGLVRFWFAVYSRLMYLMTQE